MRRLSLLALLLFPLAGRAQAPARPPATSPDSARIVTADVGRFWQAVDRLQAGPTHADSLRALSAGYLEPGSPGLQAFARTRIGGAEALAASLAARPRYYAAIRANTERIPEMEPRIREGYRRLKALYPAAVFPDVTFVVGRMSAAGVSTPEGQVLAAEMLARDAATPVDELNGWLQAVTLPAEAIPCVVVHELVHAQQTPLAGESLLALALTEGVADFLADEALGCTRYAPAYVWAAGRERELWSAFRADMHGTDLSRWLYNGGDIEDRPADLGYWMGYQIARAYVEQAPSRAQAVADLLHIDDADAFLAASNYPDRFPE